MEINERLLNDAGGWQVMKQARALHEMGRVTGVAWLDPLLEGRVRESETEFRAGLKILSRTNIENLCTCRASRQHGAICAHSIAVGLEMLKPHVVPQAAVGAAPAKVSRGEDKPAFSLTEGTPVELHLILPPNFAAAWPRGHITAGVEAELKGRRALLTALDRQQTYRVSEEDERLVAGLRALGEGTLPGVLALTSEQMLRLLGVLGGHPRVTFGKNTPVVMAGEALRPELRIGQGTDGAVTLEAVLPEGAQLLRAGGAQPWLLQGTRFQGVAPGLPAPYHALLEGPITVPAEGSAAFLSRELPALQPSFAVADFATPEPVAAPAVRFALELEGSLNHLTAKLHGLYGEHRVLLTRHPQRTGYARNPAAEQAGLARLQAAGFTGPDGEGQLILKGEGRILAFFARDLPPWEKSAAVTIGSRFSHVTADIERIRPRLEIRSSGENWFELQVELAATDGERFSGVEIQRLLQSGQSHLRNRHGKITVFDPGMIDEFQTALRDCEPSQRQPGTYRVDQRHAAFFHATAEEQGADLQAPPSWRAAAEALGGLQPLRPVDLGALGETLRPYQRHGVDWMSHLARHNLAGILADEMGLGKTVQALALLRSLGGRALIVCPSSLVYNWRREAERFTPERRVLTVEGADRRAAFGQPMERADLVVTSYALLRRDAELYREQEFTAVILDEAQHIKNPETQNAQAACRVRCRHRFILTGTPVENSVRDLWSLMHFLMPGYLGTREDFRERYEKPIQSQPGGPEEARLVKRLRPFILRRRKRDVITELPDKLEQVAFCELTLTQRTLYTELLQSTRRQVADLAGGKDQNKARMLMLTALLRLRQVCCDPRLLKLDQPGGAEESSKLEMLGELLQEMVDGGHRVLIFSQFVGMLQILKNWLAEQEIETCYLDGSTRRRGEEVDRFQQGAAPVFLISLKAGGVGLNLTAADTVVHYDPWWNPAVEAQATDRAHRIGQKKVVTSYKLIARDTVEEKILRLQEKKRQIIDAVIESEEPMMKGLTTGDLHDLLN